MGEADQIAADIGRKCSDDVSAVIRRNFMLVADRHSAVVVASYAAVTAIGAASGAFNALNDGPGYSTPETLDELWTGFFRPLMLGELTAAPTTHQDEQRIPVERERTSDV